MLRRRVVGPRPPCSSSSTANPLFGPSNTTSCNTRCGGRCVRTKCGATLSSPVRHLSNNTASSCGGSQRGLMAATSPLRYIYKPPGTSSKERSRLPWYNRTVPSSSTSQSTDLSAATNNTTALPNKEVQRTAPATLQVSSPPHLQEISSILQSVPTQEIIAPSATVAAPTTARAPSPANPTILSNSSNNAGATPPTTASAGRASASTMSTKETAPSTPSSYSLATAAATTQAAVTAALCRSDSGALRLTPARRMSVLSGPTLDARVEDIVKVEETLASELTLPKVVQLLIDPQAEGVERITMSEFAAMQPKRQLLAVAGKKEWLQWIEQSTYYQQAARLAAESPAQDLAALQQAGIHSLQQWLEHPQLVKVSARTRSALDTAVAQSVEGYMSEVVHVVNTSNAVEEVLTRWVSDVVGKFVLDSLQIPVDRAAQAMWMARKDWMPTDVVRNGAAGGVTASLSNSATVNRGADVTGGGAPQSVESRMLSEMLSSNNSGSSSIGNCGSASGSSTQQQQQQWPMLRPGEACTLDHYLRFVQKVVSSVRKDYVANHAAMGHSTGGRGDEQAEQEITERSHGVVAAALTQLLEQAVLHQLPPELETLHANSYLALDRVPGLLKRAGNLLQLRAVPVRFFVFHSSVDEAAASAARGGNNSSNNSNAHTGTAGLSLPAPPYYPSGTFLTGSNQMDVTLGEWSGRPDPPSSTARESGGVVDDATEQEYLSVLHRLRHRVDTLAITSLLEVIAQPERYGGNGFSAAEAVGLHQLFGPVKLLEDRLTTALHYPVAAADKPIHFVEAGPLSGKTALLEQLAERTTRPGDKVVLVRYSGSATPYLPDLDDHPVAFAARFWFRVALASCPYLIRTEELYSRAPRSVYWWGHEKNWSWERYQSLLQSARNAGSGHRQHQLQQQRGNAIASASAQLASILVDDVDRALGAMQQKWGDAAALSAAAARASQGSFASGSGLSVSGLTGASSGSLPAAAAAVQRAQQAEEDDMEDEEKESTEDNGPNSSGRRHNGDRLPSALRAATAAAGPSPSLEQQHQQVVSLWLSTGKSVEEHLSSCFTQLSAAVGQVNIVFTGTTVVPLLLTHCAAPCRRYYLPLSGGVGLQSRLRVLPLLATLHALHLTHHLDMPGMLYEVLKNCPALAGKALELFWSHRVTTMDLRTGLPRLTMSSGSAHPQLMQSYVPRELFAELPLYTALLQNPRRTRRRLVELLQRQLSSPTGYLSTELDTVPQDVKDGLVLPHNLSSSQVHPFALFAIFSRQDAIDERVCNSDGQLLDGSEVAADGEEAVAEDSDDLQSGAGGSKKNRENSNGRSGSNSGNSSVSDVAAAARVRSSTGVGSNERKVVRAWAEVWAEYRSVVSSLSTSPTRKRDAMRILLHGALLLRSAAVAGAQLELNLKVPSYGFPLLASETRVRSSSSNGAHHQRGDSMIRPATPETVRRATAAYKMFFSNAAPSHFPFRPMVGLNGGCDVVFVCGSTLALYDIVTTTAQLRQMVGRFAEALLGVLHVLERQVFPVDKVRAMQFVTVVLLDEPRPGGLGDVSSCSSSNSGAVSGMRGSASGSGYGCRRGNAFVSASSNGAPGGLSIDVFNNSAAPTVPYYLDYDAIFDDHVMDRLRELQQSLGMAKDFRTLNELIDEIERTHRIRVMQDVVSTPEEVESLFSPTLLQLVPDATVLPAYTSAVVSATELMMQAMNGGRSNSSSNGSRNRIGNVGIGAGVAAAAAANGAARRAGEDSMNLNLDDDDDDDPADYINLGEEEAMSGAELDDVASDVHLSRSGNDKDDFFVADHEQLHESAELLEAIMNDNLDMMSNSTARLQEQREQTARELRRDLVLEDCINYNAPAPTANTRNTTTLASPAAVNAAQASQQQNTASMQRRNGAIAGRSAAEDAEADALAWLHDIISPESLIAGLKGTAPGAGSPLANAVGSSNSLPPPLSDIGSLTPGLSTQIQQQLRQPQQLSSPLTEVAGAAGNMPSVTGPWTPNVAPAPAAATAASDGTGNTSAVLPRTTANRGEEGSSGNNNNNSSAASASGVQDDAEGEGDEEDPVSLGRDATDGEVNAVDKETNSQKLPDAAGNRRRSGKSTSATATSRRPRRSSRASAVRDTEETKPKRGATGVGGNGRGKSKLSSSSFSNGKGHKSSGSVPLSTSSTSKKKARTSGSSGSKKGSLTKRKR